MLSALSSAISGLKAATSRTRIAGNNIANINSINYKRRVPQQTADQNGGSTVSSTADNSAGYPINADPLSNIEAGEESNVDVPTEMVELMLAKHSFTANLKTIQTTDQNLGALLDIKG